jgi:transcriptional regulator PpsR
MKPFSAPQSSIGALDAECAGRVAAAAADVTLVVDADGVVIDVAWGSDDIGRLGCAEWIGRPWLDTVTIESRPKVEALLRDAAADSAKIRWRHVNHPAPTGVDLPLLYSVIALRPPPGGPAAGTSIAFGRDLRGTVALQQRLVDAQQAMERDYWKFRHAEARYRHLFQVASEAVIVLDGVTQKVLEANPAAQQLLGDGARPLVGRNFPFGLDARGAEAVQNLLAGVRAAGRADDVQAELADARGEVLVSGSAFRQQGASQLLVRLSRAGRGSAEPRTPSSHAMLLKLVQSAPDCLVVTDLDGRIVSANAAFVELAQLGSDEQARGESLDRWLGRTGVDLSVLISNLRQRGSVRLFATTLRGEFGSSTDVEISAALVTHGDEQFLGFTIRDVGRRLGSGPRGGRELPRSMSQLTELVGRVPLKDIVGETTDLIEQLCIEAALELTRDNRASAAEMLGLSRQSLYVKLRRYGLGDLSAEAEK